MFCPDLWEVINLFIVFPPEQAFVQMYLFSLLTHLVYITQLFFV